MPRYISSETTPTLNRSTFTLSLADFVAEPESIWGISVRDSLGRHTGMNWTTGDIEREIPGSYYTGHYNKPPSDTPQVLVMYPSDNSLEVVYHALEYGDGTTLVTKEPDVLVLTSSYNEVTGTETATVIAKRGSNGEHLWEEPVTGTAGTNISAFAAGDLDGDKNEDVLVLISTSETETVIAKRGSDGEHIWTESVSGTVPNLIVSAGDLGGDETGDVLVMMTTRELDMTTFTTNTAARLIAKRGCDGEPLWEEHVNGTGWIPPSALLVGDLNGDEIADVLLGSQDRVYALGYREE